MARASPRPEELPLPWPPEGAPCVAGPRTRQRLCLCAPTVRASATAATLQSCGKTGYIQPTPTGSPLLSCLVGFGEAAQGRLLLGHGNRGQGGNAVHLKLLR